MGRFYLFFFVANLTLSVKLIEITQRV